MGSTAIISGGIALVVALVCLLVGRSWGRSGVQSQVEEAVKNEQVSSDTREFAMRQQLDEAIAEIARLRPLAEEFGQIQERLRREQSQLNQMKADFDATMRGDSAGEPEEVASRIEKPAPRAESADEAIQRLLKSLERTLSEPDQHPQDSPARLAVMEQTPSVAPELSAWPDQPDAQPPALNPDEKNEPGAPSAAKPSHRAADEWQEFARSLADLTQRPK